MCKEISKENWNFLEQQPTPAHSITPAAQQPHKDETELRCCATCQARRTCPAHRSGLSTATMVASHRLPAATTRYARSQRCHSPATMAKAAQVPHHLRNIPPAGRYRTTFYLVLLRNYLLFIALTLLDGGGVAWQGRTRKVLVATAGTGLVLGTAALGGLWVLLLPFPPWSCPPSSPRVLCCVRVCVSYVLFHVCRVSCVVCRVSCVVCRVSCVVCSMWRRESTRAWRSSAGVSAGSTWPASCVRRGRASWCRSTTRPSLATNTALPNMPRHAPRCDVAHPTNTRHTPPRTRHTTHSVLTSTAYCVL
jgi:hypothetical protein